MNKKYTLFAVLAWTLATVSVGAQAGDTDAFSMKIMDAFRITGRGTVMTGRVDAGSLVTGDDSKEIQKGYILHADCEIEIVDD